MSQKTTSVIRTWRPLSMEDVVRVAEIESEVYDDPWTPRLLLESLIAPMTYTLGVFDKEICFGYAIYQVVLTESHLLNLAVDPRSQKEGLGAQMLKRILKISKKKGAVSMYLEVRKSNEAALKLYGKAGFRSLNIRENYYPNGEAAVVMVLDLV